MLDRSTLGLDSTSVVNPDVNSVITAVNKVTPDEIAIMTGAPGCCTWPNSDVGPIYRPNAGWTVIFAGGNYANPIAANDGNTVVPSSDPSVGAVPGAMSGVIRKSHTVGLQGAEVFTYASTEAVPFDTNVPGNPGVFQMQLGTHFGWFPADTGIAVMSVDPDLTSLGWRQWFPLTGDATADQNTLETLVGKLNFVATNRPGAMVMLRTNGKPKAHTTAWGDLGNALTALGGTSSVWDELDGTGDYALVGRSGAGSTSALRESASAEASGPLQAGNMNTGAKATAGTLRGMIGRGPDAMGIIRASTSLPTEETKDVNGIPILANPFEMTAVAAAAPQPWPLSDAGSTAALRWISQQLELGDPSTTGAGYCYQPTTWDLRAEYCNAAESGSWSSTITTNWWRSRTRAARASRRASSTRSWPSSRTSSG